MSSPLKLIVFVVSSHLILSDLLSAVQFDDLDRNHDGVIDKQEWNQSATSPPGDKAGLKEAVPQEVTKKESKTLIGWLERDFEIRESFFTPQQSINPAKLSWTKARGEEAFYQLDAAVLWKPKFLSSATTIGMDAIGWFVQPSFEAHISTNSASSQNQLTYRVPLTINYIPGGAGILDLDNNPDAEPPMHFISAHTLTLSPNYQTDRHDDTRAASAEIFYSAVIPSLAMGIRQRLFRNDSIQFLWQPYVGAELGNYIDRNKETKARSEREVRRFVARVESELLLWDRLAVTGSLVHRTDLNGSKRSFNYGEVSGVLILDTTIPEGDDLPHFTAGITYKRGEDAPDFVDVDAVTAWLGLRF